MDIVVMRALIVGDDSQLDTILARANTKLEDFAKKSWGAAKITVDASQATSTVNALTTSLNNLTGKTHTVNVNANTAQAKQQISALQQQADALMSRGRGTAIAGMMLTGATTAPLLATGGATLNTAAGFEETAQHIVTLTDVTKRELGSLKQQVLTLSADPNIRKGPTELADALYYVASTGLNGAESMKALKASAIGASAGLGDVKTVADTVIGVMNAWHLSAGQSTQTVDILTTAVKEGTGEANQYASALAKVIPFASQAGVKFQEVAAFIATATRVKLSPSESATALRQILNSIIDPSEKTKRAFKEIGTSVDELRMKLGSQDLFKTLQGIMDATHGRVGPITEIFGNVRALTGFLATSGNQGQAYADILDKINHSAGTSAASAATAGETFSFQLDKLKAAAERAAISIDGGLLPIATRYVEMFSDKMPAATKTIIAAWNALGPAGQQMLGVLVAILATSGPVLTLAGNIQLLGGALLKVVSFMGGGSGLGVGLAAFFSNPVVFGILSGAVIMGGLAAWQLLKAHIDEADVAMGNLAANTEATGQMFDRALSISAGNNSAVDAITKLKGKVADAGDDTGKLASALKDLTDSEHNIKNLHLSPASEQILLGEYEKIKQEIEARKIEIKFQADGGDTENWKDLIYNAYYGLADHLNPAHGYDNSIPLDRRYQSGATPNPPSTINNLSPAERALLGNQTPLQNVLSRPSTGIPALDAAKATEDGKKVIDVTKATYAELQKILDDANKKAGSGQQLTPNESVQYGQALARRNQLVNDAKSANEKQRQHDADATAAAQENQRKAEEETQRRIRDAQAKSLGQQMQMWQGYGNAVEGVLGRIQGIAESGSEVNEKTAKSRMEAEMLKRVYDGIPTPLKQAAVELAGIEYRMKRLTDMRNSMRDLFTGMYVSLVRAGADTRGFEAQVHQQEKSFNYSGRMGSLYDRAQGIGGNLISQADTNRSSLQSQQEQMRERNRTSSGVYSEYGVGGGVPPIAATSDTGMKIAEHAASLQANRVASSFVHMCDALADKSVTEVTRAYSGIMGHRDHDTAAKTMHRFQRAGIGQRYQPGMSLAPGGLLYSDTLASGTGHVQTIGPHGERLDQYGANHIRTSNFQWYVPPPGSVSRTQAHNNPFGGASGYIGSGNSPFAGAMGTAFGDGSAYSAAARFGASITGRFGKSDQAEGDLLSKLSPEVRKMFVTDTRLAVGEIRANRQAAQQIILNELKNKRPVSESDARKILGIGLEADVKAETVQAGDNVWKSVKEMGARIRLIGKENNPYAALMDAMEHGDYNRQSSGHRQQLLTMTLGGMVAQTQEATRQMTRDEADKAKIMAAGEPAMKAATFSMYEYEKATALAQKRVEIWNSLKSLRDAADIMQRRGNFVGAKNLQHFANQQFSSQVSAATGDYDAEHVRAANLEHIQTTKEFSDQTKLLQYEGQLLRENAKSAQAIADAVEDQSYYQQQFNKYVNENGIGTRTAGIMAAIDAANRMGQRSGRRGNDAEGARNAYLKESNEHMGFLREQRGLMGTYESDSPQLQIETDLVRERYRLEKEAETNPALKASIDEKLQKKRAELELEQQINVIIKSRQTLTDAETQTLQSQYDIRLMSAKTEAERLRLQFEMEDKLRERRGETTSPEEQAERQKQIGFAGIKDQLTKFKASADEMKGILESAIDDGIHDGIGKGLKSFVHGMAEMALKAGEQRIAGNLMNKWFGGAYRNAGGEGDIYEDEGKGSLFDWIGKHGFANNSKSSGDAAVADRSIDDLKPGNNQSHQFTPSNVSNPMNVPKAHGIKGALEGIFGGGSEGGMSVSQLNITTTQTDIRSQVTNLNGQGGIKPLSGGSGSNPSSDQIASGIAGLIMT